MSNFWGGLWKLVEDFSSWKLVVGQVVFWLLVFWLLTLVETGLMGGLLVMDFCS